jgi:hypothetical protein
MDTKTILEAVAIGVAVIAIIVGVLAVRRWGNRRLRLLFESTAIPLILGGAQSGLLKVTFRDVDVEDPHLVTILLKNVGPADISSDRFDAGRSLVVRLNCTMYGLVKTTHPESTVSTALGAEGVVELLPQLLRRGEERLVQAVVSGPPVPVLDSPLIDTDVVSGPTYTSELAQGLLAVLFASVLGLSLRRESTRES